MRRRNIVLVILLPLAVVGLLAIWWLRARHSPPPEPTAQKENVVVRSDNSAPVTSATPKGDSRTEPQNENSKLIVRAIEKTNVPIRFWGRVVDQNQGPIDNVTVRYSYSTEQPSLNAAWAKQELHHDQVMTDATGLFTINGINGHILSVDTVTKDGYTYKSRGARVYNFYGDTPSGKFTPTVSKPVLFVMFDKSSASSLVSSGGNFGKTLRLPADGTPVRWDVWKGRADPRGELQVIFERDPAVLARVGQPATWRATLGVIGGGIVEALPDEPFHNAPDDGYLSEVEYPKAEQKRGTTPRSFYIKTREGKYGRIEIDLYPDDEGATTRCLIKSAMNPSGSRNLEGSGP